MFLEQLEGELESENPWERVVSLVDTQAEIVEDFKDTSRMTSILIQLKNEPLDVSFFLIAYLYIRSWYNCTWTEIIR